MAAPEVPDANCLHASMMQTVHIVNGILHQHHKLSLQGQLMLHG